MSSGEIEEGRVAIGDFFAFRRKFMIYVAFREKSYEIVYYTLWTRKMVPLLTGAMSSFRHWVKEREFNHY